jgi:hypothetical protein
MRVHEGKGWRSRSALPGIGFGALILIAIAFAFAQKPATGFAQTINSSVQTIENLTTVGTSRIQGKAVGRGATQQPEIDNVDLGDGILKPGASGAMARHTNLTIPSKEGTRHGQQTDKTAGSKPSPFPPPEPVVESDKVVRFQAPGFKGFNGLSHVDQRTANNGNQFSIEPPDQGLCAGNGYVVETVNDVIRVFDTSGNPLSGVEDMNTFFGLAAAIDRANGNVRGPFLSDPRCYFDRQTQRWFVSELMEDNGQNAGATGRNFNLIAVSQTPHPTGAFTIFMYDVTDDGLEGTPNHSNCPCFGDQPLIGADTFGFYQTTNEFSNDGSQFNGAQVYAISKSGLVAAADSNAAQLPRVVHIDASQQLTPFGGLSYSLQPATSPGDQSEAGSDNGPGNRTASANGVEYFLSALQFVDTFDNRIAVWAISNTNSLNSHSPKLDLSFDVISSETYGQPNPAVQKAGEIPLGASLGDTEELLNTNDDRMNQVVLVNGTLYGAVNSLLSVEGADHQGIAWFAVQPSIKGPNVRGQVVGQGYVAVAGEDVFFPSIALNSNGNGVMSFSLSGADTFPSAAYVTMDQDGTSESVYVAGAGRDPEDGFSGYPQFLIPPPPPGSPNIARWGDYSAAVADGDQLWFAAEYIPKACSNNTPPCRTANANWGTFVSNLRPF